MDNGEGRPLDEVEGGQEDPQDWYFDLPGGAWERQEEKNRTLRERVLGNLEEDAEKQKGDPFARKFELKPAEAEPKFELRRPEPEQKKGRGLFGFGKKKAEEAREEQPWEARREQLDFPPSEPDVDVDDWSTEPPLKLTPFPRSERTDDAPTWGESDAGWDLSRREAEEPRARRDLFAAEPAQRIEEDSAPQAEDFAASIKAWATAKPETVEQAFHVLREDQPETMSPLAETEDDQTSELSTWDEPEHAETVQTTGWIEETAESEPGLFGTRRAEWPLRPSASPEPTSHAPTYEDAADSDLEEPGPQEPLKLRPRSHAEDDRKLDWNFGPAAWGEKTEDETAPQAAAFEREPANDDALGEMSFESMRKWAEKSRDKDHPHFTTAHHEAETEEIQAPPPIPLRPRHHDEPAHGAASIAPDPEQTAGEAEAPRSLPLVLRSRTEPGEAVPPPADGPSKWNDFFGLASADEDGDEPSDEASLEPGDDEPLGEGIAAMKAWAQKRPEADAPTVIPEEFLKPFDWELQEDSEPEPTPSPISPEFLKPFAWEEDRSDDPIASTDEPPAWAEDHGADDLIVQPAPPAFEAIQPEDEIPATALTERPAAFADDDSEDPLAGLFEAPAPVAKPEKKAGRFGRLFGRKKENARPEPALEDTGEPGDWLLPSEDDAEADIRVVVQNEWREDDGAFPVAETETADSTGWSGGQTAAIAATEAIADFGATSEPGVDAVADDLSVSDDTGAWQPESAPVVPAGWDWTPDEASEDQTSAPASTWEPEAGARADADEESGWAPEPVASFEWNPEPVAEPVEAVASVEATEEPVVEKAWWEAASDEPTVEMPVEAVASVEVTEEPVVEKAWWETAADEPAVEVPVEAVASVEVTEEPVVEKAWWEAAADEPAVEVSVEAVASVEVTEEPVVEEAWWEAADDEPAVEVPVEAVASVDVTEEPVVEKAWWETAADEPAVEVPVEAVASVETTEEPAPDAEMAWWQHARVGEAMTDEPVHVIARVEPAREVQPANVPVVPVVTMAADEPLWWEHARIDDPVADAPIEPVASVEVVEETVAETPWWEQKAVEDEPVADAPVEAVASVDVAEEPVVETPWWEQKAVEDEPVADAPVEAVASVDVVEETVAETPWWEQKAIGEEPVADAPVEAVASVDVAEETVAETPWWEQKAVEDEPVADAPVEAVVVVEDAPAWGQFATEQAAEELSESLSPVAEVEAGTSDDDDPWADFVSGAQSAPAEEQEPPHWAAPAAPPVSRDEDMWGAIAASAEEAAAGPDDIDLAASLESQMAEAPATYSWSRESEEAEWHAAPERAAPLPSFEDEEEDVILAAFNRHAATPEAPVQPHNDEVFSELLGEQAAEIVAEASEEGNERSFLRMSAWAPQRSAQNFDGGWAPDSDETTGEPLPLFGGNDGPGFEPPSWALEEAEADEMPAAHHGHRTKTWIRELVETGLLALLVFLSVRASFQNFKVEGSSMYPTLEDGQFLIVNKLVYSEVDMEKLGDFVPFIDPGTDPQRNVFHGPERGDIVVLIDPRNPETDLIKRVIGLPGETVEIVDGKVYINDRLLEEPYIKSAWHDTRQKITVPPGEYFVMGDNRDNSLDSRSSQVSTVPKDLIIGKAMLSYWPTSKFGLAPNEEGKVGDEKPVLTTQRIGE